MLKTHARTKRNSHHSSYDLFGDIEKIKAALSDASDDVKGRANEILSQYLDHAKEKSAEMEENLTEYVTENTFKSLGVAFLAGAFLGFIIRRS